MKVCNNCGKEYSSRDYRSKYCSRSCAASFNNKGINRHKTNKICSFCVNCGKLVGRNSSKYCSNKCMQDFIFEKRFERYLMCNFSFGIVILKRILVDLYENECQECGIDSWNGKKIVLDIEHIDGDSNNNDFLNLSLLCQNCHAQTETYKGRNKGNGRHSRRKRYMDGKSY